MHHLDKTDFQMQRNLRNRPSFHHKKYRLMLDPLIIIPFIKCIKISSFSEFCGVFLAYEPTVFCTKRSGKINHQNVTLEE